MKLLRANLKHFILLRNVITRENAITFDQGWFDTREKIPTNQFPFFKVTSFIGNII